MKRTSTSALSWLAILGLSLVACGGESEPARGAPVALEPPLARTYQAACADCHARPGIGAPLTGVDSDWRERRAKGMDALLENTVSGYGGMPPLGTCGRCSVDDFRKLISYMAGLP